MESIEGERYVVVYSDHESFRQVYSQYARRQFERSEVVILLPYYDTTDKTRSVLRRAGIDVAA